MYDVFRSGYVDSIGPNGISGAVTASNPNTKAYRNGNIINTEVTISNISASGNTMTLSIKIGGNNPTSPTAPPTPNPTPSPPTPTPTVPTASTSCSDSSLRFKITKSDGRKIMRNCEWVSNNNTNGRCALTGVAAACASTCNTCDLLCEDSSLRFKMIKSDGRKIMRACEWVSNNTSGRCQLDGVKEACRVTCNNCGRIF